MTKEEEFLASKGWELVDNRCSTLWHHPKITYKYNSVEFKKTFSLKQALEEQEKIKCIL